MREGGLGNQILASPGNLSPTRDVGPDPDYDNVTGAYRGIGSRGKGVGKDGKALPTDSFTSGGEDGKTCGTQS